MATALGAVLGYHAAMVLPALGAFILLLAVFRYVSLGSVVAALVLHDGASVDEVKRWCVDKLQRNETPEIWQVLAAIPKTISEKPIERDCINLLESAPT